MTDKKINITLDKQGSVTGKTGAHPAKAKSFIGLAPGR
jgi:hypothetical protein